MGRKSTPGSSSAKGKRKQRSSPVRPIQLESPESSATPPVANPQNVEHPFLQFDNPDHIDRFERLKVKPFEPNRRIHWPTLEQLGLAGRIRLLIDQSGWGNFFEIHEPTYRELTLEFLSTYELDKDAIVYSLGAPSVIKFQLGGISHRFSVTAFGVICGFYTEEFT